MSLLSLSPSRNLNEGEFPTIPSLNYYVSNNGAIDNDGLTPATAVTPAGFPNLDISIPCIINLNKGETLNMTIPVVSSNNFIQGYGSGANPILIGSTDISGLTWTDEGDGTWSTAMAEPNWIYIGGVRAKISQTPWITITGYPATNQFVINNADVAGYGTITGSRLVNKPRIWTTEYLYSVTNYDSGTGTITINTATTYRTSIVGTTLQLFGKKAYFVDQNEWAWEGGKLYIKSTVSPSTLNIRASNQTVGVSIADGASNTQIEGIDFADFYYSGIKSGASNNTFISNCTVYNSSGYGIAGIKSPNIRTVINCTVYNCNGGIYDRAAVNLQWQRNTIHDIGTGLNIGFVVDYDLADTPNRGMSSNWDTTTPYKTTGGDISYNTVYNTAYIGIAFQGSNLMVHHNIVHDFLLLFDDGGGIYTFSPVGYTGTRFSIYNNIIYNGLTNSLTMGIYADNRTSAPSIFNNTIYLVAYAGINLNAGTSSSNVQNNIVVDCPYDIRYVQDNSVSGVATNTGNVSLKNILAVRSATQYCHKADVYDGTVSYNPYGSGGVSNNNYYISPYTTTMSSYVSTDMTFTAFKTRYGNDASSSARVNWLTYTDHAQALIDILLFTNETASPVTQSVGAGYIDVNGNSVSSVAVPAYGGCLVLKYP